MEKPNIPVSMSSSVSRNVALMADKNGDRLHKIEDTMGLLVRNFSMMMNRFERRMHQHVKQHVLREVLRTVAGEDKISNSLSVRASVT